MNDLLDEILKLIDKGSALIDKKLRSAEKYLSKAVKKILKAYDNKGTLEADQTDFQLAKKVREAINKAINKSGYLTIVPQFEGLMNDIETLAKRIVVQANSGVLFSKEVLNLTQEKKIALEEIAAALSSPQSIKANITSKVQAIIYQSIANQVRYKDAVKIIEPLILGDAEKGGLLSRYYKQVTTDALSQWDGAVNQAIGNEYGLIDYLYAGGTITTSRPQCIRWVGTMGGRLSKEVVEAEMDKAIKTLRSKSTQFKGYSIYAVPTVANFARVRGGHNCRHRAVPILMTEDEAATNVAKYNAMGNKVSLKYQNVRKD